MTWLRPDGRKLLAARALRALGYGYLAVVLAVYLRQLGLSGFGTGLVLTAAVAGSALMNVVWSLLADRFGRRRTVGTLAALGLLFFWVGVLSGLSLLAAGRLASRFGLLNTMVLSHLPSNLLLLLVPLAPTAWLAVLLYLARMSVSQMDVPTRKSYTMAVVDPDERTAAAGITNLARTAAGAVGPALGGAAVGAGALALPFIAAGGLKVLYDGLIYLAFRGVRPPEEEAGQRRGRRAPTAVAARPTPAAAARTASHHSQEAGGAGVRPKR